MLHDVRAVIEDRMFVISAGFITILEFILRQIMSNLAF